MTMNDNEYKELSIKEFTKAAGVYETDKAGVYKLCKKDYPDVLAELEKEPFDSLLDCGCGTAPMISLLHEKYPEKHYTGIDLTPKMIEVAKAKNIPGAEFAKKHDLLHVLPLMCNSDYFGIEQIHGTLIRCGTCGNSPMCDYCVVGNKNPIAEEYVIDTDENGFLVSRKRMD